MSTGIFIKTCKKDLEWLRYCLLSIQKYASGFHEIIIVADESCRGFMDRLPDISARLFFVPDWKNGYIQQQSVKLMADTHSVSDVLVFIDSDVMLTTHVTPADFMRDGKPVYLKTLYSSLGTDRLANETRKWKPITENVVGWHLEYEYMRRMPMVVRTETLRQLRLTFPGLQMHLREINDTWFSEFNVIGAFVDRFEQSDYFISDTEVWMPAFVARQFRSWDGMSPEIVSEMENILV